MSTKQTYFLQLPYFSNNMFTVPVIIMGLPLQTAGSLDGLLIPLLPKVKDYASWLSLHHRCLT